MSVDIRKSTSSSNTQYIFMYFWGSPHYKPMPHIIYVNRFFTPRIFLSIALSPWSITTRNPAEYDIQTSVSLINWTIYLRIYDEKCYQVIFCCWKEISQKQTSRKKLINYWLKRRTRKKSLPKIVLAFDEILIEISNLPEHNSDVTVSKKVVLFFYPFRFHSRSFDAGLCVHELFTSHKSDLSFLIKSF